MRPKVKANRKKMNALKKALNAPSKKRHVSKISKVTFRSKNVVPDRWNAKLMYNVCNLTFTNNGINHANYILRGNNVYDPDPSIGNLGCRGFNTFATLYNKYRVKSSKLKVQIVNNEVQPVLAYLRATEENIGVNLDTDPDICSQPYIKYKHLQNNAAGSSVCSFTMKMPTAKILGLKSLTEEDGTAMLTTGGAIPGTSIKPWYWIIGARTMLSSGGFTTGRGLSVNVVLEHDVDFYDRKNIDTPSLVNENVIDSTTGLTYLQLGNTGASGQALANASLGIYGMTGIGTLDDDTPISYFPN